MTMSDVIIRDVSEAEQVCRDSRAARHFKNEMGQSPKHLNRQEPWHSMEAPPSSHSLSPLSLSSHLVLTLLTSTALPIDSHYNLSDGQRPCASQYS